jgi:hypothetical protein
MNRFTVVVKNFFMVSALFCKVAGFAVPLVAQERKPDLMGVISSSQTTDTRTPYNRTQDEVIEYFSTLQQDITSPAALTKRPPLDPSWINYLNAAYLYCSVNVGVCPYIIQSIFEVDLINSKLSGSAQCPNMLAFWKGWVDSDMENRHKYLVKTAYLNTTDEFRRNERPKFLQCKKTIGDILAGAGETQGFFMKRYQPNSESAVSIAKTVQLFQELKRTVGNVIVAVGAASEQTQEESDSAGSKKEKQSSQRKVKK